MELVTEGINLKVAITQMCFVMAWLRTLLNNLKKMRQHEKIYSYYNETL